MMDVGRAAFLQGAPCPLGPNPLEAPLSLPVSTATPPTPYYPSQSLQE